MPYGRGLHTHFLACKSWLWFFSMQIYCQIKQRNIFRLAASTPAAVTEAVDRMGEVAPQIQDDFDLQEGVLAELELQDRPENQVILPQSGRVDWHDCRLGSGGYLATPAAARQHP